MDDQSLVYRLRKRAEIRRSIATRKSVQEGKPDRIADLLEEAANEIEKLQEHDKKSLELIKELYNALSMAMEQASSGWHHMGDYLVDKYGYVEEYDICEDVMNAAALFINEKTFYPCGSCDMCLQGDTKLCKGQTL